MNRLSYTGSLLFIFLSTSSVLAMSNWPKAETLFQTRNNVADTREARKLYLEIIKDKDAKMSYRRAALSKYGRLALYEGVIGRPLFNINNKQAAKVFKGCMEATEILSPKKIHAHAPEYYYWRASCIALWLANIHPAKAVIHAGSLLELQSLIAYGQENFPEHDGYGFDRIEAGLLSKTKALTAINLYQPEKALELLNKAIARKTDVYVVYLLKAETLVEMERYVEAIDTLELGIKELTSRLKNNAINRESHYENLIFLDNMHGLKSSIMNN